MALNRPRRPVTETGEHVKVSAIVPVRNESAHIEECLAQLVGQAYPRADLEILVIDGMSQDGTREIVERFIGQQQEEELSGAAIPSIRLIENPRCQRASSLNIGITQARGDVVLRVDARTMIPSDYVMKCVETLTATGADNVGGVQRPIARTPTQEAIGIGLSHPFGAGDAQFRLGKKSGFVDTVYLGCFRREVFDKVGLFDEEAPVISEDSDMNQRIREAGGKVYLNKDIIAYYYPRETFRDFWKLYFRYGGARAGNLLKHRCLTSWRQAGWPLFILGLTLVLSVSVVDTGFLLLLAGGTGLYLLVNGVVSLRLAKQVKKLALFPRLMRVFACIHFAYGLGFWKRLLVPDRAGTYWEN